jgi:hypothetical protein
MSYSSLTYRMLISAPGDVPESDIETVMQAVARWNANYGLSFGSTVVPLHWRLHSAARHGARPQATLNSQLVASVDILLALFWHRLGTDTGEAISGTVEEIEEAQKAGAYVGILSCGRAYPAEVDEGQLSRLREFFEEVRGQSLVLDYADEQTLTQHADAIIYQAVARSEARSEAALEEPATAGAEVWPRVENRERQTSDSKGRISTKRDWQLVLSNTGQEAARDVRHRLEPEGEDDQLPIDRDDDRGLEVLAPGTEAHYPMMMFMGVAPQARCVVTWTDSSGEHENIATLRFF